MGNRFGRDGIGAEITHALTSGETKAKFEVRPRLAAPFRSNKTLPGDGGLLFGGKRQIRQPAHLRPPLAIPRPRRWAGRIVGAFLQHGLRLRLVGAAACRGWQDRA